MHKPAQVELQLDRPQLPYSETLGPIIAEGSPILPEKAPTKGKLQNTSLILSDKRRQLIMQRKPVD